MRLAHRTTVSYTTEPGQTFEQWRRKHFTEDGRSLATGEEFTEHKLENMFWFRQQRYSKPVPIRLSNARA